jgi:hypothetical protein
MIFTTPDVPPGRQAKNLGGWYMRGNKKYRFQVSAQPPAKKKPAGQIEKETDERRTSNIERPTSNNEFCQFY